MYPKTQRLLDLYRDTIATALLMGEQLNKLKQVVIRIEVNRAAGQNVASLEDQAEAMRAEQHELGARIQALSEQAVEVGKQAVAAWILEEEPCPADQVAAAVQVATETCLQLQAEHHLPANLFSL
jgi:hypothetical protein